MKSLCGCVYECKWCVVEGGDGGWWGYAFNKSLLIYNQFAPMGLIKGMIGL